MDIPKQFENRSRYALLRKERTINEKSVRKLTDKIARNTLTLIYFTFSLTTFNIFKIFRQ